MTERIVTKWNYREAVASDASDLTVLIDIASRGLLLWLWQQMVKDGQSALEFGRERIIGRQDLPAHFKKWRVATENNHVAGAMAGYVVPSPYDPGDIEGLPGLYKPLLELEAMAAGTWHLMALAVYPAHRNIGLGTQLLRRAEFSAASAGCSKISIIANSENEGACRLYRSNGYSLQEKRPYVPFPNSADRGEWFLFEKSQL